MQAPQARIKDYLVKTGLADFEGAANDELEELRGHGDVDTDDVVHEELRDDSVLDTPILLGEDWPHPLRGHGRRRA